MIKLTSLTKLYSNKRGIRNISLNIDNGEILGLLGPNGSGKTTLMKAILGLISPDSGTVEVDGAELQEDFENIMHRTGALIESPAIYKEMTAYKNLKLMAHTRADIADIDRVLKVVHMEQYKNDKAGKFSLGMKQRLGIAAAFLGSPDYIILDEPVNGLDIEGVVDIREYIKALNQTNGTTFIISSHIADEIEKVCTRIAVMYDGEMIACDSTAHILECYPSVEEYFLDKVHEKRGAVI